MRIEYLKEKELAKKIKRSVHTLRRDRFESKGIPYIKIGSQILYPSSSVDRYLEEHLIEPEKQ